MADTFQLEVATPERGIVNEPARNVTLPGAEGYFEVLPEHGGLLSILDPGVLSYQNDAGTHFFAIDGGFAEVLNNCVRVLTTHIWYPDEIDVERARNRVQETSRNMKAAHEQPDYENAMRAHKTALALVDTAARAQ